jgi:4-carboxymuconolactone decarboxylase
MNTQDRYQRGWEKLKEVDGEAGERVVDSLKDISPDFARLLIEFPFGDIYSRPGLDLRSREIAVVAALTALGNAVSQLKVHIHGALNVGCTRQEVVEVIRGRAESAGINRHRVGDERAPHKRRSCSIMAPSHVRIAARLYVMQLTGESAGQPLSSEITHPGCRPCGPKGKATL